MQRRDSGPGEDHNRLGRGYDLGNPQQCRDFGPGEDHKKKMRKKLDKKALQRRDLGPGEDHNPGIVVLIARGSEVQRRARGSGEDHNNDKVEVAPGLITAAPDSGPGENHNLLTLHSTRLAQAAPELRSGEDTTTTWPFSSASATTAAPELGPR